MTDLDLNEIYSGNLKWLVDRTIFCTVHGSQAYGTSLPTSDTDVKGVVVPPKEYYFSHDRKFEQAEQVEPDMVIYSLQKFVNLASNCNPNIIEVLFTDPEHWIKVTPVGQKLYENRHLFLSKKAKHTFSGYAMAQLKRIKNHKAWLLNPPTHKPTREEYGLDPERKVSKSAMGAFDSLENNGHKFDERIMKLFVAERAYHTALTHYSQYQNWKRTRNEKRAALEAKYGYDCKHAMHLVRLMRMGEEILTSGEVLVKRPDAEELLSIRSGEWTYDHLLEWAEKQDEKLSVLYESSNVLPRSPDNDKIRELCVELTESMM